MSWQEYNSQPRENRHILELESEKGKLLYYGTFHSVNLQHPQFAEIEQRWAALIISKARAGSYIDFTSRACYEYP